MKTLKISVIAFIAMPLLLTGCAFDGGGVVIYPPAPCAGGYCGPLPPPYGGAPGYPVHHGQFHRDGRRQLRPAQVSALSPLTGRLYDKPSNAIENCSPSRSDPTLFGLLRQPYYQPGSDHRTTGSLPSRK